MEYAEKQKYAGCVIMPCPNCFDVWTGKSSKVKIIPLNESDGADEINKTGKVVCEDCGAWAGCDDKSCVENWNSYFDTYTIQNTADERRSN